MAQRGWEIRFSGVQTSPNARLAFASHPQISVRLGPYARPGVWQKLRFLRWLFSVLVTTIIWRPDWLYASDVLSTPVALLVGRLRLARVLYQEHDSPEPLAGGSLSMRVVHWCRQQTARLAAICILPNKTRAERFAVAMHRRQDVITVSNYPSRDEIGPKRSRSTAPELRLIYWGSIVPLRPPITIVKALRLVSVEVHLRIIGYTTNAHPGYLKDLMLEAREAGVAHRVEFLDPMSHADLFQQARDCDVGVALMPMASRNSNESAMVGASNKPMEYLSCGLAILVSDMEDWRRTYVDPGYGLACDPGDPKDVARCIQWLADHRAEMRAMGERGRQRLLLDWNYESAFAPVLDRLTDGEANLQ